MIRHKLKGFVPPRFLKRNAFRYLYSFALVADATLEAVLQGMGARLPGYGTETADGRIARDRGIRRGFAETHVSFAARVIDWLTAHRKQGSAWELMRQVQGYCGPVKPRIRHVWVNEIREPSIAVWRTLNSDGTIEQVIAEASNFAFDGLESVLGSRAWLIIYATPPNEPWISDGTWDDTAALTWDEDLNVNGTWGSTALRSHVEGIWDIIREWRSAATVYPHVIISFDDTLFDPLAANPPNPDASWIYDGKVDAGAMVAARAGDAIYWDQVA